VQIQVSEPRLLGDLCDYLSRHGLVAISVSQECANVLVPGAGSDAAAAFLLASRLRAWTALHPGTRALVTKEVPPPSR
jgi:hypothetical protein